MEDVQDRPGEADGASPPADTLSRWLSRGWLRPLRLLPFAVAGCDGPQSALDVAGIEAERVAELFWIMLAGAGLVWVLVIGTAIYATRIHRGPHDERVARWFLLGGGVALPIVVLGALLSYGLSLMSGLRIAGDGMRVSISGEQWWWRVRYEASGAAPAVSTANEVRLPAGERVELVLESPDVIHSLWIPPLGGKMDMIPGRVTRLVLEPTRPGVFRGVCAEFCGTSHALMAFSVVVMEPGAFDDWLAREAAPATSPPADRARRGAELFRNVGCGACHTIRGTSAEGRVGPDLTHLAGRATLAAGSLPMTEEALVRWIADPDAIKPGVRMPGFAPLGEERIGAIAAYLATLE